MSTTVQVSKDTAQKLKDLKEQLGVKSMDDVIARLMNDQVDDGDDVRSGSEEEDAMGVENDDVQRGKLEQGVFASALTGSVKAVKHFTGLKEGPYKWVLKGLQDAVRKCHFFCVMCVGP
jgi:predicted CopG family antitoxin